MTSNPVNLAPEDQFLLWRQELEARQEEQARQVAELLEQANQLREENERLRTRLEADRAGQSREPPRPFPLARTNIGKEVVHRSCTVHPPRATWKPTQEKGHLAGPTCPSALQGAGRRENPAGIDDHQHQLTNMCQTEQGASFHLFCDAPNPAPDGVSSEGVTCSLLSLTQNSV